MVREAADPQGFIDEIKSTAGRVVTAIAGIPRTSRGRLGRFVENIPHPWAGGGIVTSSHLGIVGEAGPRGHHPVDQPGAAQLMAMSGLDKLGGGGGGANTYNITMNAPLTAQTNADANMIGDEIVWALAPLLALVCDRHRRSGGGGANGGWRVECGCRHSDGKLVAEADDAWMALWQSLSPEEEAEVQGHYGPDGPVEVSRAFLGHLVDDDIDSAWVLMDENLRLVHVQMCVGQPPA